MHPNYVNTVIYITGQGCAVCKSLRPKVERLITDNFNHLSFQVLSREESPEQVAQLQVFSIPTIIIFIDNKETFRYSRHVSIEQIQNDLERPYNLFFS